jgi:hypothetical protein
VTGGIHPGAVVESLAGWEFLNGFAMFHMEHYLAVCLAKNDKLHSAQLITFHVEQNGSLYNRPG